GADPAAGPRPPRPHGDGGRGERSSGLARRLPSRPHGRRHALRARPCPRADRCPLDAEGPSPGARAGPDRRVAAGGLTPSAPGQRRVGGLARGRAKRPMPPARTYTPGVAAPPRPPRGPSRRGDRTGWPPNHHTAATMARSTPRATARWARLDEM